MALTPDGLPETSPWQAGCFTVQVLAPVSCPWTKSLAQGHTACQWWRRPESVSLHPLLDPEDFRQHLPGEWVSREVSTSSIPGGRGIHVRTSSTAPTRGQG